MSYILDALRRAESERERGHVPGLHAQPPGVSPVAMPHRRRVPLWAAVGVGAIVGIGAAAAWWWGPRERALPAAVAVAPPAEPVSPSALPGPTRPTRPAPAEPMPPRATAPSSGVPARDAPAGPAVQVLPDARPLPPPLRTPPPAPVPSPPPVVAATPAPPVAQTPPAPPAAPRAAQGTPSTAAPGAAPPAPPPQAAPATPAVQTAPPTPASPGAPAAPAASPPARPMPLAELPAALRSQLPAMTIGGVVYSEQAASRFLMINGQVVHEGESPVPGVTLERIGPRSAVIRWREQRIEVPL